jgi:hypothetical protein
MSDRVTAQEHHSHLRHASNFIVIGGISATTAWGVDSYHATIDFITFAAQVMATTIVRDSAESFDGV